MPIRPLCATLGLAAALALLPAAATADDATSVPAASVTEASLSDRQNRLIGDLWWNQSEVVASLQLSDAQRAAMDDQTRRFFQMRTDAQARQQAASKAYAAALDRADWDAAARHVDEAVAARSAFATAPMTLKIDVLRLLEPEQLDALRLRHGHLMRQAWMRAISLGNGPRAGRRGARAPGGSR
ncbi:MAG: hypothetical protein AAF772_08330 [Acidobacteriota bacterium]